MLVKTHLGALRFEKEDILEISDYVTNLKGDGLDYRLVTKDNTGKFSHHVYGISENAANILSRQTGIQIKRERQNAAQPLQ